MKRSVIWMCAVGLLIATPAAAHASSNVTHGAVAPTAVITPSGRATTVGGFVVISGRPGDRREVPLDIEAGTRVQATGVSFDNGTPRFGGAPLDASSWVSVGTSSAGLPVVRVVIPADQKPADYPAAVRVAGDDSSAVGVLVRVEGNRATSFAFEPQDYEVSGGAGWPLTPSTQSVSYRVRNDGDTAIAGDFAVGATTLFSTFVPFGPSRDLLLFPSQEIVGTAEGTALPTAVLTGQARVSVTYTLPDGSTGTYAETANGESKWAVPWLALSMGMVVIIAGTAAAVLLQRRARHASTPMMPLDDSGPNAT